MKTSLPQFKRLLLLGALLLPALLGLIGVRGAIGSRLAPVAESQSAPEMGTRLRESSDGIASPAISFIDSPSATCSRPTAGTGACYISWNYLYVTAAPSYVVSMSVTIDNRLRGYHVGFFQTQMYIPFEMTEPGYKVTCGWPGTGANAGWGNTYNYIIRARDSGGLSSSNMGLVTCPADVVRVYLPFVRR